MAHTDLLYARGGACRHGVGGHAVGVGGALRWAPPSGPTQRAKYGAGHEPGPLPQGSPRNSEPAEALPQFPALSSNQTPHESLIPPSLWALESPISSSFFKLNIPESPPDPISGAPWSPISSSFQKAHTSIPRDSSKQPSPRPSWEVVHVHMCVCMSCICALVCVCLCGLLPPIGFCFQAAEVGFRAVLLGVGAPDQLWLGLVLWVSAPPP